MPASNLRVVVACVTFETVMVVEPVKHYKADRVYLLHQAKRPPYSDFLREVQSQLGPVGCECIPKEINVNSFKIVLKEVLGIIRKERASGNHLYVNVGAGPNVFAAAALIACNMEGATAFNVGTRKFTVEPNLFYVGGRPVGMSSEVREPYELPGFDIRPPKPELVQGLHAWQKLSLQRGLMSTGNLISRLKRDGLLQEAHNGKNPKQADVMKYRRTFLDPWLRNGWLVRDGRSFRLTELGESILDIF